jgi:transposase
MDKTSSKSEPIESPSTLQARIEELEIQLKHAELKSEMLETMIDLAEEEFKLDIRKKSGTNQSNR